MIVSNEKGKKDHSELMRSLDPKQRKSLELFREYDVVTSKQVGNLFGPMLPFVRNGLKLVF